MRAAIIVDGKVGNVIEVDSLDAIEGLILVEAPTACIGDIWDGEAFHKPAVDAETPSVPQQVAMWQARTVLIEEDLLDDVTAVLAAIPGEKARKLAQAKFEYSNTVRRDDPLLTHVIPQLGKTESEIDAMFIRAAGLP